MTIQKYVINTLVFKKKESYVSTMLSCESLFNSFVFVKYSYLLHLKTNSSIVQNFLDTKN
jgi:hypothetical protein